MYKSQKYFAFFAIFTLSCGLAACAWSPVESYLGHAPRLQTIYVIASGWHTEIGLAAGTLSGPIAKLRSEFPHSQYFVFGWGERDYYMAPNPGFGDLVGAVMPAPAAMLVIPIDHAPPEFFTAESSVFAIPAAQEGLDRLSRFLWDYLDTGSKDEPRRIGDGPYPQSAFYASNGTYSLGNTCNTWTAAALHVAGLPVSSAGVLFASQVVAQARGLAKPD